MKLLSILVISFKKLNVHLTTNVNLTIIRLQVPKIHVHIQMNIAKTKSKLKSVSYSLKPSAKKRSIARLIL